MDTSKESDKKKSSIIRNDSLQLSAVIISLLIFWLFGFSMGVARGEKKYHDLQNEVVNHGYAAYAPTGNSSTSTIPNGLKEEKTYEFKWKDIPK